MRLSWAASRKAVVAARNWRVELRLPRRRASKADRSSTGRSVICVLRLNNSTDFSAILRPPGERMAAAIITNTPNATSPPMANNATLIILHPIRSNVFI